MENKIKYTPQGFSYVDVTLMDCISWGGLGICNSCGKVCKNLKLVWVLADTYCDDCFNDFLKRSAKSSAQDIEHDLNLQREQDIKWYKYHGVI